MIDKCIHLDTLDMLLQHGPPGIKDAVILQYSKVCTFHEGKTPGPMQVFQVLPHDPKARRAFVVSGGLKYILQLDLQRGTPLYDAVEAVNACYPPDIVK